MFTALKKNYWLIISAIILIIGIKGSLGNPNPAQLLTRNWKDSGPFELSPERGRYAIIYSLIENHSFFFPQEIAEFATPDLGFLNNKYVSLFPPGLSILGIPGYIIGKSLGAVQVGTFATNAVFAFINLLFVFKLSKKIGASQNAAILSALIFTFATPAFAFSGSFFQHHASTLIILLSLFLIDLKDTLLRNFSLWFLFSLSVLIDYPNFFMMLPIAIQFLTNQYKTIRTSNRIYKQTFKNIIPVLGAVIPLFVFLWFNYKSYGSPFRLSGTVNQVLKFEKHIPILPESEVATDQKKAKQKTAFSMFGSRDLPQGLFAHILSPDRGLIFFTPVVLYGIIGGIYLSRKNQKLFPVIASVASINVVMYSMFGIGGWSFGSRYLIPTYAMLSIMIGPYLTNEKSNLIKIGFLLVLGYSYFVNLTGGLTSNANPPKVEAIPMSISSGKEEKYTFVRNVDMLIAGKSKSFVYQTWLKNMGITPFILMAIIFSSLMIISTLKVYQKSKPDL